MPLASCRPRATIAACLAGLAFAGCSPAASPGTVPATGAMASGAPAREVAADTVVLTGTVRPGGGSIEALAAAALNNASPLAQVSPLNNASPLSQVVPLNNASPLSRDTPAGNAASQALRIGLLGGVGDRVVRVEAVDPASGQRLSLVAADADGKYRITLPSATIRRAVVVQSTIFKDGAVAGFLAGACRVGPGSGDDLYVDLGGATTLMVFCATLRSGVRSEFRTDVGFRGFKTPDLVAMLTHSNSYASDRAVGVLDGKTELGSARSFSALLSSAAEGARVLAQLATDKGAQAGGTMASGIAACNLILDNMAEPTQGATISAAVALAQSAGRVSTDLVTKAAAEVIKESGPDIKVDISAKLPPGPTPGPSL